MRIINLLQQLFPLWALVFSLAAWLQPAWFIDLKSLIIPLLTVVMFSMGLTLSPKAFVHTCKNYHAIFLGVGIQYLVMPLSAWLIAKTFMFSPEITAGMILVGCTSGGTASNVICYLARGNVALSISMTAVSTLLAVVMLPLLTWLYLHNTLEVPAGKIFSSVVQIVLLPVLIGSILNYFFHTQLRKIEVLLPLFAMFSIVLIIAIIVALNAGSFMQIGAPLIAAVVLHNVSGLLAGYFIPRYLGCDSSTAKTIAIETGMQNSGLSVALAVQYFSSMAALPGALFSIWHNLSGSVLAGYWNRKNKVEKKLTTPECRGKNNQ